MNGLVLTQKERDLIVELLRRKAEVLSAVGGAERSAIAVGNLAEKIKFLGDAVPVVWISPRDLRATMVATKEERAEVSACRQGEFVVPLYADINWSDK